MKLIKFTAVLAVFVPLILFSAEKSLKKDPVTNLIIDKGLEDVKENCTVCHTGRFIILNGGDKRFWEYKVLMMQNAYGLWKLKPEVKKRIVNYLAKYYSSRHNISLEDD